MAFFHVWRALPAVALLLAAPELPALAQGLTVGVAGSRLTVNGDNRFLVLASYFDALDAAALERDLDFLAARVDGIRIFPNWWDYRVESGCGARFSPRTLMRVSGDRVELVPERLQRLTRVLREARARGLVVDLSLAYETVRGLSRLKADAAGALCGRHPHMRNAVRLEPYARAVGELARALAHPEFDHVFFDLQNEANGDWTRLPDEEVARLAAAVRAASPARVLSVSLYDPDPAAHLRMIRAAQLDLLNFHDFPRGEGWWTRTGNQVARFREALDRAGLDRPVYDGEPSPDPHGEGAAAFRRSLQAAQGAGAAAWTFHTRAGFHLDRQPLEAALDEAERAFFEELRTRRARRQP